MTDYFLPQILNVWFETFSLDWFFCCFETEIVLKIKDSLDPQSGGEPLDSKYACVDEFVPAERSESSKNTASSNKSMAGLWCFLRDEVLLKYFWPFW
jgi:hypothetical protein